jgi:hypothetical protein
MESIYGNKNTVSFFVAKECGVCQTDVERNYLDGMTYYENSYFTHNGLSVKMQCLNSGNYTAEIKEQDND